MTKKRKQLSLSKARDLKKQPILKERHLNMVEVPETGEFEIHKKATSKSTAKKIRFPKEEEKLYQLPPEKFENVQNALEAYRQEKRQVEVAGNSLESYLGYDSLIRVMNKYFYKQYAFRRSEEGGALSPEEARKEIYQKGLEDEEAIELFRQLMRKPTDQIGFRHLAELQDNCPVLAQNLWEMIKREAAQEFESGHLAADALEPADYMTDAWNRASYIGIRESFIEEWQPKGGIEMSMIDAIAQAWLQLQFWTKQSVLRAKTQPREEHSQFHQWKQWSKQTFAKQWDDGFWDPPTVSEKEAIEQAAQMAERCQRMYFRAIRSLRDWRRYTPQVTINNPQQVNIAADGGQQINVSKNEDEEKERIVN